MNKAKHTATGATGSSPSFRASSTLGSAQLQPYLASVEAQSDGPVHLFPQTPMEVLIEVDSTRSVVSGGTRGTGP